MSYTMKDVDIAIKHILGEDVFNALMDARIAGRIVAHKMAIEKAFIKKIDNRFTNTLRESLIDLNKGVYKPIDNKFENENDH